MQKQPSSEMCFVCGRANPIGFHLHFFQDDQGCIHADYTPREEHQGFPGIMHGGLVTALLDETLGRSAIAQNIWCMTVKLDVRFKKNVPIGQPLKIKGEITKLKGRLLEGKSEIFLADGTLAAEAFGTFLKIPDAQMQEYQGALMNVWRIDE